jgi:hypothetical protein
VTLRSQLNVRSTLTPTAAASSPFNQLSDNQGRIRYSGYVRDIVLRALKNEKAVVIESVT